MIAKHIFIHISSCTCAHMFAYAGKNVHIYRSIHTYIYIYILFHIYKYINIYIYIYLFMYHYVNNIHTHTHVYIYLFIYLDTRIQVQLYIPTGTISLSPMAPLRKLKIVLGLHWIDLSFVLGTFDSNLLFLFWGGLVLFRELQTPSSA
jgi:hypothetical protein